MATRVYNRVARRYDEDWSGIYASARSRCMQQISTHFCDQKRPLDTVDLGVGTGNSLRDLGQVVSLGQCTGFDLSSGMLEQASAKLRDDAMLVCADARDAVDHLQSGSSDLVLCHFLLSFVDPRQLLQVAHKLLRPGGMLSLVTSTRGSLRELHSGRFRRSGKLLGVRRSLQKAYTPGNHEQCLETLRAHGFDIVKQQLNRQNVRYESFDDVRNWALNSGWAAGALDGAIGLRIAGFRAIFALARVFMHPLYPIDAVSEISIVLAQKPPRRRTGANHRPRLDRPAASPAKPVTGNEHDRHIFAE